MVARGCPSNRNLHFGTRFQMHLSSVFVGERVLDANLLMRVIRPFDEDLRSFRLARGKGDSIIVSTVPSSVAPGLSLMACPF